MSKKVVFITARLPYPANSGRKNVMYNYCKLLHEEFGFTVSVVSFLEPGDMVDPIPEFIDKVITLPRIGNLTKIWNIIVHSFIKGTVPIQVSLFYSSKIKKLIKNYVTDIQPDYVICDMVRTTEYGKDLGCTTIADLDDRLSVRYQRQLDVDYGQDNPFGAYLKRLPKFVQKFILGKNAKTLLLRKEISLLTRYELHVGDEYDWVVFVAKNEAKKFNADLGERKAVALPLGVNTKLFPKLPNNRQINYELGFLGAMNVSHNSTAVKYFIDEILPIVHREIPNATFHVIGGGADADLLERENKLISFSGRVDNVTDELAKCQIFVAPLLFGSGIKTKNLEAMSLGIPVVTNSIGAENISAVNGRDWIVRDDKSALAASIIQLLEDKTFAREVGENGASFVRRNFTWEQTKLAMTDLFKRGR
ncbi:glycosyltransferase family 4 protein [Lactiplantibacillus plantarum]|uniref:glycosyltransferase family 4 protein n=1 Tax=Lactiplantibacillus plantarum TaxID=1590 RepID=UPI0032E4BFD4